MIRAIGNTVSLENGEPLLSSKDLFLNERLEQRLKVDKCINFVIGLEVVVVVIGYLSVLNVPMIIAEGMNQTKAFEVAMLETTFSLNYFMMVSVFIIMIMTYALSKVLYKEER